MSALQLALFGSPVARSKSPRIHQAFAEQFGLDIDYRLIEASAEAFPGKLESFRSEGGVGCNITLPLKTLAFEQAAHPSQGATLAQAANTLWWDEKGDCHADNTDGPGLVADLEGSLGFDLAGFRILLLGAGGAAAGVLGALLARKPASVTIANRTLSRASELAQRHQSVGEVNAIAVTDLGDFPGADLVLDATSSGHQGTHPTIPYQALASAKLVYSLNYGAAAAPLGELARLADTQFHDGLGMLVEQAACSFEIWTGKKPATAPVLAQISMESV